MDMVNIIIQSLLTIIEYIYTIKNWLWAPEQ
jgi:hypothetical protein